MPEPKTAPKTAPVEIKAELPVTKVEEPAKKVESPKKVETPPKAEVKAPSEPKPASDTPAPEKTDAAAKSKAKGKHHEIILEALDKVEIRFLLHGQKKVVELALPIKFTRSWRMNPSPWM